MLLILNTDDLTEDHLVEVKSVLKNIETYKDYFQNVESMVVYQKMVNNENMSLIDLRTLKKDALMKNSEGKLGLFLKCYDNFDEVHKIKVSVKKTEEINENYENSDRQWYKQYAMLSERIIARNRICRYFKKYQLNFKKLLKNRKNTCHISFNLMEFFGKESVTEKQISNVKRFLMKNKFVLKFYDEVRNLNILTMRTYYLNIIDNGLDFHYLLSILNEISDKRDDFEKELIIQSDPKIIGKDSYHKFINLKSEVGDLTKKFKEWIDNNHSPKITEVKLQQSKKSIALKFAKRHLYRTANKMFNMKNQKEKL